MINVYVHSRPNPAPVPVPCTVPATTGYPKVDMDEFEALLLRGPGNWYTNQQCHILRLLKLVSKGKLKPSDFHLFFDYEDVGWVEVQVESDGEILGPVPDNFFSWALEELLG